MPVASRAIVGRRVADDAISRNFGARGCAVHTPSTTRPGALGERLTRNFEGSGFTTATKSTPVGTRPRLVEVYPHVAVLALLGATYRVPYKVSKTTRYWPGRGATERAALLVAQWTTILEHLRRSIAGVELNLPRLSTNLKLRRLKRYEDAIDALVCGWVGIEYLAGRAVAFGDEYAAIWVPLTDAGPANASSRAGVDGGRPR